MPGPERHWCWTPGIPCPQVVAAHVEPHAREVGARRPHQVLPDAHDLHLPGAVGKAGDSRQ